jgi:glycerol-3-phosphate dehydrogenase
VHSTASGGRQLPPTAPGHFPSARTPEGEALADGVGEVAAQVLYARDGEWALTADDLLRRAPLALSGRDSDPVRDRVETLLAS